MNLQTICEKLGKNNSAVYTVVAVACFKGIFRPLFTMMDKKQEPKSKKYAAIREGSTEIIAIPTYIALAKLTEKLAPKLALDKSITGNFASPNKALHFVGVCIAALVVIPGLCNVAMPYILKAFKSDDKKDQKPETVPAETKLNIVSPSMAVVPVQTVVVQEKPKFYNLDAYGKVSMNTGGGIKI